jgi:hypothetical protein
MKIQALADILEKKNLASSARRFVGYRENPFMVLRKEGFSVDYMAEILLRTENFTNNFVYIDKGFLLCNSLRFSTGTYSFT